MSKTINKRIIFTILVILLSLMILPACGREVTADVDLTRVQRTVLESTVAGMQRNPKNYIYRTYKIKGNYTASTKTLLVTDNNCCSFPLGLVATNGVKLPTKSGSITIIGKYIPASNGKYALQVSKVF